METASYMLIAIGGLAALAGFLVVVTVAFRVSVGWGLAVLFLSWLVIPLVVFLVKYWPEARAGFLLSVSGWVISGVGSFLLAGSLATNAVAELDDYNPPPRQRAADAAAVAADEAEITRAESVASAGPAVPTTTPSPLPRPSPSPHREAPADRADPSPTPPVIPLDEAGEHLGETVMVDLTDGTSRRVVIDAVASDGLRVTQQVGGGAMSYPLRWEVVAGIRPLRSRLPPA